ncbi:MAG TPA: sigma-70 family RNA polymerase sigma factor, partial [Gemmataceae bacterium]|nr:sigma-70 family RNA polymerase sigma factor [Gemmataceae bacterium]
MAAETLHRLVETLRTTLDSDAWTDAELLARFRQARDPAAFEAIVRRHGPRVLTACRKVLHHDADVDDAFQATFVVLMRGPQAVRRGSALGPWLFGVAHRVALQARAARRRRERLEARASAKREAGPDLSWPEACAILHEELDRLPERLRRPLLLCYLEGKTRDEAAAELGRTVASIKKALEKGRETLRKRLSRRGVTLSAGLLSAVAVPVAVESADVSAVLVEGIVHPSTAVGALARAVGYSATLARRVGLGLAASALAVGLALGFPGGPKPDPSRPTEAAAQVPIAKDPPAKAAPFNPPTEKGPPARLVVKEPPAPAPPKPEQIEFTGRVIDPDGRPMKGARVFIAGWSTDYPGKDREPRTLATADSDGRFAFTVPAKRLDAESEVALAAATHGFGLAVQPLRRPWPKEVTLALARDFPLAGRLLDERLAPVVGATVRVIEVRLPDNNDLAAALAGLQEVGWSAAAGWLGTPFARRVRGWYEPLPGLPEAVQTNEDGRFTVTGIGVDRLAILLVEGTGIVTSDVA